MVDQLERAEVAEEKRSVFRALTRLRGAAITSFDGVARSQTGNIDEYNKIHQDVILASCDCHASLHSHCALHSHCFQLFCVSLSHSVLMTCLQVVNVVHGVCIKQTV